MKVREAIEQFELACKADGLADTTVKWYQSLLKPFAASQGETNLQDVSPRMMREYIVALREQESRFSDAPQKPEQDGGYSRETIKGHVTALHRFWSWCASEYDIPNPMARIRREKRTRPEPKTINRADFVKLFNATLDTEAGVRDRAMLAFFADTGCRLGGLLSLTTERLDTARKRCFVVEKGIRGRTVYFTYATSQMLDQWLQVRNSAVDAVFTSVSTGKPLTQSGVHEALKRLKRRAGVSGRVNPHSFRHNFARQYLMSGGELATLAKLLGHSDIQTTYAYYALFSEDELAEMHRKYGAMDEWFSGGDHD